MSEIKITKLGTCIFCRKQYSKSGMHRHLKSCKKRQIELGNQEYFTIAIEDVYENRYFLYIDIESNTTLYTLDKFLRTIWVECCDHQSAFYIREKGATSSGFESFDVEMGFILKNIFEVGDSFRYLYDFGTSTRLKLKIVNSFYAKKHSDELQLLARNVRPAHICAKCGEPAIWCCSWCYSFVCEKCSKIHDCGDEGMSLIVNSPRIGYCGFDGDRDTYDLK